MMCFEATKGGNSNSDIHFSCLKTLSHTAPQASHKQKQEITKHDHRKTQQQITKDLSVFLIVLVISHHFFFFFFKCCHANCEFIFATCCCVFGTCHCGNISKGTWTPNASIYYTWTVQRQCKCM